MMVWFCKSVFCINVMLANCKIGSVKSGCDTFLALLYTLNGYFLMGKRILIWFRNDLRLHDNEVLNQAVAKADEILPVYIFDDRQFKQTKYHTLKTGLLRARFLLESVADLQKSLIEMGGDLLIEEGLPEAVLPQLVDKYQINEVYHHREVASEETAVSTAVEDSLWKQRINLRHIIGHTLYNKEDLPFPIKDIPDVFAQFKKKTERDATVKPCLPTPKDISFVPLENNKPLPRWANLYPWPTDKRAGSALLAGGEQVALSYLNGLLHKNEGPALQAGLKKHEMSSKLSAWLSLGCISPRQVYWAIKGVGTSSGFGAFCQQILLGLLWRDYYRFMFKKYGNRFFAAKAFGTTNPVQKNINIEAFENWKAGKTDNKAVNTVMQALNATGYASNLGRQLVATYLVQVLGVNWIFGAYYFEEVLLDYTPASNWGNWVQMAGVGNDKRLAQTISFDNIQKAFENKALAR